MVFQKLDPRAGIGGVLNIGLGEVDPDVHEAISAELTRQESTLEMIASENFAPLAVMQAQGSVLTNKYAEAHPGRRYCSGCEYLDVIGLLALAARGINANGFAAVADIITTALRPSTDEHALDGVREEVTKLAMEFPLYPKLVEVVS